MSDRGALSLLFTSLHRSSMDDNSFPRDIWLRQAFRLFRGEERMATYSIEAKNSS